MSLKLDLQKYKPRKEQKEALSFIDSEYQNNKLNKREGTAVHHTWDARIC